MIKRLVCALLLVLLSLLLLSCSLSGSDRVGEYYSVTFFAMDTEVTIKLSRAKSGDNSTEYFDDSYLSGIVKKCSDIASEKEVLLSRTKAESEISKLNGKIGRLDDPAPEVLDLITRSIKISEDTDGAFDITVGTVTELWNVTSSDPIIPDDVQIEEALSHVGYEKVTVGTDGIVKDDKLTKFDLGAVGKGYTLGVIIDYLKTTDVLYGVVSFGGNVGVFGCKPDDSLFKVGITDATEPSNVIGYVYIDDGFVSVSGNYERFFTKDGKKYSHIFDPSTGRPAETDISSVAVICDDPALADALSTALFVKGSTETLNFYDIGIYKFEAIIQTDDDNLILTDGLNGSEVFEINESSRSVNK